MPIPFFPKTTKHPGDRVVLPKYPASFFAGLSDEVFEGKVAKDRSVVWKGEVPTLLSRIDANYSCLIKP